MAEILCFYSFSTNENSSGYFVIENNVTYDQLVEFVHTNQLIDETYQILSKDNEDLAEKFTQIIEETKQVSEPTISIIFKKVAPLYPSLVPEPQVSEPERLDEYEKDDFLIEGDEEVSPVGPTIREIMKKIGMKFDEDSVEDIQKCINSIPFPYSFIIKGFIGQIKSNPSSLKGIVEQAAIMFTVDSETLLKEVELALYYLENGKLPESVKAKAPVIEKEEEKPKKVAKPFIGPIIGSVLDHVGVNYSSLNSPKNITQIIDLLPVPFNFIVKSCLQQAKENSDCIKIAIHEIAKQFDFDADELQDEVIHIIKCLNGEEVEEEEEEIEEPEVIEKENKIIYHPAVCDHCASAIAGVRYLCLHCKTYDLCSACEQLNTETHFHDETHVFAKIKDASGPYYPEQVLPFINPTSANKQQPERVCGRFGAVRSRVDQLENQIADLQAMVAKLQENN